VNFCVFSLAEMVTTIQTGEYLLLLVATVATIDLRSHQGAVGRETDEVTRYPSLRYPGSLIKHHVHKTFSRKLST
jgi:hypothetical protein